MKGVIHVLLFCLLTGPIYSQKIYLRSSFAKFNEPVGGLKSVKDIVKKELVYPTAAMLNEVEGSVVIVFTLNKNGSTTIEDITGSEDEGLRKETVRLFNKIRFRSNDRRPVKKNSESFQIEFSIKGWYKLYSKRGYKQINYPHTPVDTSEALQSFQLLKEKPTPIFAENENYRGFNDYIAKKLEYPEEALKLGLKGQVVITFVIEQSGQVTNIDVLQGLGAGCTQEALRLIKNITWYPGVKDGKAVRTLMVSSIGFGQASNAFKGTFNQGGSTGR